MGGAAPDNELVPLRVLIANERRDRLELLAEVVAGLGHEVIAREVDVSAVAAVTARERPDVALVGLGLSSQRALELIEQIVRESSCRRTVRARVERPLERAAGVQWRSGPDRPARAEERRRGLGSAVSHGCVRLANATMRWLVLRIGPGVPVTITS